MGGITFAEQNTNLYICKATVAMTDGENIQTAKVTGKLQEGDMIEASSGEVKQDESGIFRIQGKAVKSGEIGLVTTKGNAGTVFAEVVPKYFSVRRETQLNKRFEGTDMVRKIDAGETFKVLEGPKVEKSAPESRIKVRVIGDGSEGWVSRP